MGKMDVGSWGGMIFMGLFVFFFALAKWALGL